MFLGLKRKKDGANAYASGSKAVIKIKDLPLAALKIAQPKIEDFADDLIEGMRDRLEANDSVKTAALTDALSNKVKRYGSKTGFYLFGAVGVSDNIYIRENKKKVPVSYAYLVEYGNPKHNAEAKPFLRPTLSRMDANGNISKILTEAMKGASSKGEAAV